jgi:hypothetical protein
MGIKLRHQIAASIDDVSFFFFHIGFLIKNSGRKKSPSAVRVGFDKTCCVNAKTRKLARCRFFGRALPLKVVKPLSRGSEKSIFAAYSAEAQISLLGTERARKALSAF